MDPSDPRDERHPSPVVMPTTRGEVHQEALQRLQPTPPLTVIEDDPTQVRRRKIRDQPPQIRRKKRP